MGMINAINTVLVTFGRYGYICHNVYALMFWGCGAYLGCRYSIQSRCGYTHVLLTFTEGWRIYNEHTHTQLERVHTEKGMRHCFLFLVMCIFIS